MINLEIIYSQNVNIKFNIKNKKIDQNNIKTDNRNCKDRQRQQQNQLPLRNFYQPLTHLTEEIKTVESPIVPDNTSYAGVLTKGKNVTVLGDSMISALRSPLVEMLFTSFSGAYMSKQCTVVIDYLLYCDLLHFTYK